MDIFELLAIMCGMMLAVVALFLIVGLLIWPGVKMSVVEAVLFVCIAALIIVGVIINV